MRRWKFEKFSDVPKLNKPVMFEGLPGIGNVGKIVVDFMIDELKAVKIYEVYGHSMPNSVFVNEDNMVELPKIEIFYKQTKGEHDLILLTGDVQPIDEESCYEFCDNIIEFCSEHSTDHIVTLGGIGLGELPDKPIVYCTGNNKKLIAEYKKEAKVTTKVHGVIGPIVGVSGLLLGLSQKKNINAVSLLSETLGHPMFLGIVAARETLKAINNKFNLKLDIKKLDEEIKDLENKIKNSEDLAESNRNLHEGRLNYIG